MSKVTVADLLAGLDTFTKSNRKRTEAQAEFERETAAGKSPTKVARRVLRKATSGMENPDEKYQRALAAAGIAPQPQELDDGTEQVRVVVRPQSGLTNQMKLRLIFGSIGLAVGILIAAPTWYPGVLINFIGTGIVLIGYAVAILYILIVIIALSYGGVLLADAIDQSNKSSSDQQFAGVETLEATPPLRRVK